MTSAIQTWEDYLNGDREDLGSHPAYFLFLDDETPGKVFVYREEGRPDDLVDLDGDE